MCVSPNLIEEKKDDWEDFETFCDKELIKAGDTLFYQILILLQEKFFKKVGADIFTILRVWF